MSKYGYYTQATPKLCAICGSNQRVEAAHISSKGIGGRGSKAPKDAHDTVLLCSGTGGNTDSRSCHGLQECGLIMISKVEGIYRWYPHLKAAKILQEKPVFAGMRVKPGFWYDFIDEDYEINHE